MKTVFYTIIILLISSITLKAQTDANIFGHVKHKDKHIPFVMIAIEGSTIGTSADATGHYKLTNLPEGKHTLIVSAAGYKQAKQVVNINKNTVKEINFSLEKDMIGLDEVIVSSDRSQAKRAEASMLINTVGNEVFSATQSVTLAEGLNFSPGIRTEHNCQNCGFAQVRMNGMEGPYSQILINSRPIFSGLAGVYGLELFPPSMIDKIEIVKGGGSALFGGNAIAGTINLITKEPQRNSFNAELKYDIAGITEDIVRPAADMNLNIGTSVVSENNKAGMTMYAAVRDKDPYDENNDGFSEEVKINSRVLGFNTYYKPGKQSKISLDFFNINENRRGGNKFDYLLHEADIAEAVEHNITGVNLVYDYYTKNYNSFSVYTSGQRVARDSYYGAEQDPNAYGFTSDLTSSSGAWYKHKLDFLNSKVIAGFDHKYSTLEDTKLGAGGNDNTLVSSQQMNVIGSFAQYEIKQKSVKLTSGLRFDSYNIRDLQHEDGEISGIVPAPRVNLLIDLSEELQWRMSYARGYRAPQIFDEDLHIETSGARQVINENHPNLKQETSNSFSGSLRFANIFGTQNPVQTELVLEGFYTQLQNPFTNEYSAPDENGIVKYLRMNAESGAQVYGTNLESNLAFSNSLLIQAGFTYQQSRYDEAQAWGEKEGQVSKDFLRTPNAYGFLSAEYEIFKNLKASLSGTYTGSMLVPHFGLDPDTDIPEEIAAIEAGDVIAGERLEVSEDFYNIGLQFIYGLKIKNYHVGFKLGMSNIFNQTQHSHDRGIYRDAGYIYGPCQARSLNFGLSLKSL